MGYNFGYMIASDTQFDSMGGFSRPSYPMIKDIAEIECQRVVAMATNFGTKIAINWLCVDDIDLAIGYEGGCRLLDNFDNTGRKVCCKVSLYN